MHRPLGHPGSVRTLAIETATEACSVALFEEGALLAASHRLLGRGHAEQLVPMIAELPDRGKAERLLVSLGPGSFTGVRIGIATARALAIAWRAEVLGYSTLALVAAMALERSRASSVAVVMTGGHGEWFVQSFGGDGAPVGEAASLPPDEAVLSIAENVVAGTQAAALTAQRGGGQGLPLHPDARLTPLLAEARLSPRIAPMYGRPPDARMPA